MLEYHLSRPQDASNGGTVAVLLHGRGSHRGDLQALRSHLPDAWTLLTPQAPHPGHPWGYGPGWAWYRYLEEDRVAVPTLERSLEALDAFLAELPHLVDFEPGSLVLGGFSQGGTTSVAYALTRPDRVDTVLNFSGFLVDAPLLEGGALSPEAPPIYWGHGLKDPAIPHSLARRGRKRLADARVRHRAEDYPIGHWIDPAEVESAVSFVKTFQEG